MLHVTFANPLHRDNPSQYSMTGGVAGSQVTLCGEWTMTGGVAGSQVTLCGEWPLP